MRDWLRQPTCFRPGQQTRFTSFACRESQFVVTEPRRVNRYNRCVARTIRPTITSEELSTIRDEWQQLHAAVPGVTPFVHPAWHETWLRHFGQEAHPLYLAIRLEDALIGALALDMATSTARTLGDSNVRDYGGPFTVPGSEQEVAHGVLEWLLEDMTPAASFWGLAAGSLVHDTLLQAADFWGWKVTSEAESVCPTVDLPATFEGYVAALPKHDRHELRRKLRHLEAAGDVQFTTATAPDAVRDGMDSLFSMMRASRADKAEFLTPQMEAFFRDLAVTFAELGMTRLATLSLNGEAVATLLAFDCGGQRYLYNSGYDPARQDLAVGLLSKALSLRDAIESGLSVYDFLRGDERYKFNLGGKAREIVTLHLRR